MFDRTALITCPSSVSEQEPRNRAVLPSTAVIINKGSGKSILRVQFFANISTPSTDTMVLTGSLPQLTAWGCGCPMKAASNSYHYDLDIEVEKGSTDVIEFQYMYLLVRSPPNRPLDALRPLATGIPVWESKPSRCKLHLAKILDHVPANSTPTTRDRNVKIVFQATGIETTSDTELLLVGTDTSLGELDLKKSCTMKKNPAGTYQYTIFVGPSTSFSFWFTLMRKSASLFHSSDSQVDPSDEEAAILWTSGIGTVKQAKQSRTLAVIHLLDNWDVSPELPVCERRRSSAPASSKVPRSDADSDSRLQCKVCWEEDSQAAFVPCGHAATCWNCSAKVRKCPICRAPITERIRIYL
jgi:hypothetical protein